MACVENIPPGNDDSEMEEGEIVDDLDDLSDISSEEEFLMLQRLQVLENYNNVLERKKAKNSSFGPGKRKEDSFLNDFSEISTTDLDENLSNVSSKDEITVYRHVKESKHLKPHYKQKKKKDSELNKFGRVKEYKKKVHHKKRIEVKIVNESSEESDDEYRNKRRKLENAVVVNTDKNDKSSLHDRLQKMLCGTKPPENTQKTVTTEDKQTETEINRPVKDVSCSPNKPITDVLNSTIETQIKVKETEKVDNAYELVDLCTDDDTCDVIIDQTSKDIVDSITKEKSDTENKKHEDTDSDEDLELLRQHALNTKALKAKPDQQSVATEPEKPPLSEDEDSDTAELRLICLKSALLKKAIEMKQKQKLRKRLSQSSNLKDDFLNGRDELMDRLASENNTDIESVDMDMGSDADEKEKELTNEKNNSKEQTENERNKNNEINTLKPCIHKEDELEEDEDLLRAKLLTSLSKNLPNLVDPSIINTIEEDSKVKKKAPAPKTQVPEKRIIINVGESDSEGEHEATKNLTKMHMKLSEQIDFQQKLDMFLKSTRMEVEKKKLPDVVQDPATNPQEKFVAKTVNHLPKTEQIEYKNLVKRMAELQKIKEARQCSMNIANKGQVKDTLKPRNTTFDPTQQLAAVDKLEEQITLSRKKIAEESATMMRLKEEGTKLSQKYKIVASELKNIATAITLNKKEQRTVQNRLSKIRAQHQRLLHSTTNKHSKINGNILNRPGNKVLLVPKLQKENNPSKDDYKNPQMLKPVKVSVANDASAPIVRLSVEVDVTSNTKNVTMPNIIDGYDIRKDCDTNDNIENWTDSDGILPVVEKGGGKRNDRMINTIEQRIERRKELDDYESPLQALDSANWEADPNAIMCPFEVGGYCKDPDCKYLHTKIPQ